MQMFLAGIGPSVYANRKFVRIGESMVFASFAVKGTEPKITSNVPSHSSFDLESERLESQGVASRLLEKGPRSLGITVGSLKRKALDVLESPRFRRGFVWSDSDINDISPSALYTETAPPLPAHTKIQEALHLLGDAIKVETPFDVNKLELLLVDHPNQPFVKSVMKGLREGF